MSFCGSEQLFDLDSVIEERTEVRIHFNTTEKVLSNVTEVIGNVK